MPKFKTFRISTKQVARILNDHSLVEQRKKIKAAEAVERAAYAAFLKAKGKEIGRKVAVLLRKGDDTDEDLRGDVTPEQTLIYQNEGTVQVIGNFAVNMHLTVDEFACPELDAYVAARKARADAEHELTRLRNLLCAQERAAQETCDQVVWQVINSPEVVNTLTKAFQRVLKSEPEDKQGFTPLSEVTYSYVLMTVSEWENALEVGAYSPDDGSFFWANESSYDATRELGREYPKPDWATRVLHFPK